MATILQQISYLSCQVLHNGVQWLIYSRNIPGKGIIELGATDGAQKLFCQTYTWESLKSAFSNSLTEQQVATKIREAFQKSHIQLSMVGAKLKVDINSLANFEIYELSGSELKGELSKLLFSFAEKCMDYKNELQLHKTSNSVVDAASPNVSAPQQVRSGIAATKRTVDLSKTSAINAGAKIRKKATGLPYD